MSYLCCMIKLRTMTGDEFKSFYTAKGYTQRAFADELDYDPRQLRRWETGECAIPRYILLALEGLKAVHENVTKKDVADTISA
jgi:transcriptional regulator with XRE-family HTH domain